MKKKILIISIISACILVFLSIAPSITAFDDPVPDLDCEGDFHWIDVVPGATVQGSFTVENIGEPESLLNWEIISSPDWGEWSFDPEYGINLSEGESIIVEVEVVFPDPPEEEQLDEVVIINSDNPDDYCVIDAYYHGKPVNDDTTEPLDIGRTIIRGFGLFPHFNGDNLTFFYLNFKSDLFGWITLRIANPGFMIIGPFNIIIYVFGASFKGGIEW